MVQGIRTGKRVPPVGNVAPDGTVHVGANADVVVVADDDADVTVGAPSVPIVVALVVCAPLPLGGRSALVPW